MPTFSYTNPFDHYAPYWESIELDQGAMDELTKAVDFFWKPSTQKGSESVSLKDMIASRGDGKQNNNEFVLTRIFQRHANKVIHEDIRIEAGEIETYIMDNPGSAVSQRLNSCQPWKSELLRLCRSLEQNQRSFYIVTRVYTCKNLTVSWTKQKSTDRKMAAEISGQSIAAAAAAASSQIPVTVPQDAAKALDTSAKYERIQETGGASSYTRTDNIRYTLPCS